MSFVAQKYTRTTVHKLRKAAELGIICACTNSYISSIIMPRERTKGQVSTYLQLWPCFRLSKWSLQWTDSTGQGKPLEMEIQTLTCKRTDGLRTRDFECIGVTFEVLWM